MKFRCKHGSIAVIAALAVVATAMPAEAKKKSKRTRISAEAHSVLFYGSRRNGGGFSDFGDTLRSGVEGGIGIAVDHKTARGRIDVDVSTKRVDYFSKDYRDRWNNRVALGYTHMMTPTLSLGARGAYATDMIGLEFDRFNQTEARGLLTKDVGPHRLRVGGGYRWRTYDDLFDSKGKGMFADADYRYSFGDGRSMMIDFGFDTINADFSRRDYTRFTITPSYSFPVGERTDITLSSRWRSWTYDNRIENGSKRKDGSIQPMVEVSQRIGKDWYVDAGAGYRWRWSNHDGNGDQGPRLQIGIRKKFNLN